MKAGIIAAGHGERFRRAGITTPKPLIEVGGRTLLARAIDSAAVAGASEVAIIVNADLPEVEATVRRGAWPVPVEVTVRTTPSSMESVFALAPALSGAPFLLLTVDAIVAPGVLPALAREGLANGPVGTLAVTELVDDEKPLHAEIGADRRIVRLGPAAAASPWITSGLYVFHPEVFGLVAEARRRRLGAFRELLALILERGGELFAFPAGETVDVDRPEDLAVAERLLRQRK